MRHDENDILIYSDGSWFYRKNKPPFNTNSFVAKTLAKGSDLHSEFLRAYRNNENLFLDRRFF